MNFADDINQDGWTDWQWQQRNSLRTATQLTDYFPNIDEDTTEALREQQKHFRYGITPHTLRLVEQDEHGNPVDDDPIWTQVLPTTKEEGSQKDSYEGGQANWELNDDFPTDILQHKYPYKALFRLSNVCLGYCNYCFEVERTTDKDITKAATNQDSWENSLDYLDEHNEIDEVILSGGDPLILSNDHLRDRLASLRRTRPNLNTLRVNTRSLTFNPYRFGDELIEIFKEHKVTHLGIHIAHPREITEEFKKALKRFDDNSYGSIRKLAQIPLVQGVNDDEETLRRLFTELDKIGVEPYYLLHDMPWTPGAHGYRTPVRKGVKLINALKRRIGNPRIPEYIIVHHKGKKQVPLEPGGTPHFKYTSDDDGYPVIKFKNWKDKWETYLDAASAQR